MIHLEKNNSIKLDNTIRNYLFYSNRTHTLKLDRVNLRVIPSLIIKLNISIMTVDTLFVMVLFLILYFKNSKISFSCEYDKGSQVYRNPENIKIYLEFLRTVAFKMFEKNDLIKISRINIMRS